MFRFGRTKKKEPLSPILNVPNADYAVFVKNLFNNMEDASKAHVLVAYQNLIPIISAMRNFANERGSSFSLDEFIIECDAKQKAADDEINVRRFAWFMWAALVYRLVTMSGKDVSLRDTLAEIWCDMARCTPLLKSLLPRNVVWKTEEKVWFELILNEPELEMVAWAINHGGPKVIWKSPAVKQLADQFGLFYSDSADTMGPVFYFPPPRGQKD